MDRQQMSGIIKSVRDKMRQDPNLDTDVKRMPQISWLFFLKAIDDMDEERAAKAEFSHAPYYPLIEKPYRWRDWATSDRGITGDDLLKFIDNELLPYLKDLQRAEKAGRIKIGEIFKEVNNEARNGYLLRDVINLIDSIDFNVKDDIYTLSHLYEDMLRELRDAAGSNGEFYTPRSAVRFIVERVDPRIGETVLDPAAGTCGFLVEALQYMQKEVQSVEDRKQLMQSTLYGKEKKPMPYLLGNMNLILHGLDNPNYTRTNSLGVKLNDIKDSARVDVIVTNPPFGGTEEPSIKHGFPADKQTSETALLFIQLIVRLLRRPEERKGIKGGRCGMVVPNGFLFGDGVCARIKEQIMDECNLHTIIRLPKGVFQPYTGITTNLIFFDYGRPTEGVWFYEMPLPEHLKNGYTKTNPQRYDEYEPLIEWWEEREENEQAWYVEREDIDENYNLDLKNPNAPEGLSARPPEELLADILKKEKRILEIIDEIKDALEK